MTEKDIEKNEEKKESLTFNVSGRIDLGNFSFSSEWGYYYM